jgi:hypothetical protein
LEVEAEMTIPKERLLWTCLLAVAAVLSWNVYVGAINAKARQAADPAAPLVLSGADVGFRVEGRKGKAVVGRFVVRVNGQWLDVDAAFSPKVLTTGQ